MIIIPALFIPRRSLNTQKYINLQTFIKHKNVIHILTHNVQLYGTNSNSGAFVVVITLRRGVLDTTLCDKVCQWLATDRWFSPGTTVSSTNKAVRHDITEILLKVALNTINLTNANVSIIEYFSIFTYDLKIALSLFVIFVLNWIKLLR